MKRQINRLTATAVRNAKKDVCDGYGLWLQLSRYDTKSWLFRYMIDGRDLSMGLGPLNTVSLARAREKAQKARELLEQGINPREARDAERRSRKLEAAKALSSRPAPINTSRRTGRAGRASSTPISGSRPSIRPDAVA